MTRSFRFIAALCLVLPLTTAAFASDMLTSPGREKLADRREAAQPKEREAAPLLYALPALGAAEAQLLEIRIIQAKYWLVRETVSIPAGTPDAVIDVLFTHPAELTRLRAIETSAPGSLRFMAMIGERVLTDEPFAEIEARGTMLTPDTVVGEIRTVEARKSPKLRVATESKDPVCTEPCDVMLASCLEWADPRGSDANQCYSWHYSCSIPCGDVPDPCTEPKSTSTYSVTTLTASSLIGSVCAPTFFGPSTGTTTAGVTGSTITRARSIATTAIPIRLTSTTTGFTACWLPSNVSCHPSSEVRRHRSASDENRAVELESY